MDVRSAAGGGRTSFAELFAHWQGRAPVGRLPGRQHIDPLDFPRDLLPRIVLFDVERTGDGPRFRIRVAGTHFVELCGQEPKGKFVDEIGPRPEGDKVIGALRSVLTMAAPAVYSAPLMLPNKQRVWAKRLALPLARDGEVIDMVLTAYVLLRNDFPAQPGLTIFDRTEPRPPGFGKGWYQNR